MGAIESASNQAVSALQANNGWRPPTPDRTLQRLKALPEVMARCLGQGPRAATEATEPGQTTGVQANNTDRRLGLGDSTLVELQLDVMEGPGRGQISGSAWTAATWGPVRVTVEYALLSVVVVRQPLGGRPTTEPRVWAP